MEKFANSKATKEILQTCVNPTELKLKVRNVSFGPKCGVVLEGDDLNAEVLQSSQSLARAGLEVKREAMLNPRLIVHDIPVNLESDDIVKCIVDQNLPHATVTDVKVTYLYPAGQKKFRTCVIEVSPDNRLRLLNSKRVNIGWMACRVDDHISVRQCYKCMGFGHLSKECDKQTCCGFCAGDHLTTACKKRNSLKCNNCFSAKHASYSHAATDKAKCGILRKMIEQRISFINYGR